MRFSEPAGCLAFTWEAVSTGTMTFPLAYKAVNVSKVSPPLHVNNKLLQCWRCNPPRAENHRMYEHWVRLLCGETQRWGHFLKDSSMQTGAHTF